MHNPVKTHGTQNWILPVLLAFCFFAITCPSPVAGQLQEEMRDLLTELLPELEPDLQAKFKRALDSDSNSVILTPNQFRKFREHPLNPFDGMSQIDPDTLHGNIELKFEIPSLRDRTLNPLERNHPNNLAIVFPGVAATESSSVVQISDGKKTVCLGTVVELPLRVLTKASEVSELETIRIVVRGPYGEQSLPARAVNVDANNDLAILEPVSTLPPGIQLLPVQWSVRQPTPGEFVITPSLGPNGKMLGTYSNPPRAQKTHGQGFLGIQPENCKGGVRLVDVTAGGAADIAGLKPEDIIVRIDDVEISDVSLLVSEIGRRRAGDEVTLQIKRGQQHQVLKAVLAGRDLSAERASKFRMMNRLGAIPSKRSDGFEWVFQHDTPLFPEHCGGPILDIDGKVIGINIAREGRVSSLAIPAAHLQTILPALLRENVAAKPR